MSNEELEQRLWDYLRRTADEEIGRSVRIANLADQYLPVPNKQWVCDTVKSWDNRGLVIAQENGARAQLTEKGVRLKEIHNDS